MMYVNTLGKTQGQQKLYDDEKKVLAYFAMNGYDVISIDHKDSIITYTVNDNGEHRIFEDYADAGYPVMYRLDVFSMRM